MTFDTTKPCRTRDGREVRLFTERMKDGRLVGTVANQHGVEAILTWMMPDGSAWNGDRDLDLINTPEKRTVWVNFYKNGDCTSHGTQEWADLVAKRSLRTRLACIKVEFKEGEGL